MNSIIDTGGNNTIRRLRHVLTLDGILVLVGGGRRTAVCWAAADAPSEP